MYGVHPGLAAVHELRSVKKSNFPEFDPMDDGHQNTCWGHAIHRRKALAKGYKIAIGFMGRRLMPRTLHLGEKSKKAIFLGLYHLKYRAKKLFEHTSGRAFMSRYLVKYGVDTPPILVKELCAFKVCEKGVPKIDT